MKERIQFLLVYFGFWVVYFLSARVIFLSYHVEDSKLLTIETVFGIFWNGIRMDFSMAAYLSIFPFFWVTFSNFIKKSIFQNTIFTYTFIVVIVITLIIVIDLEVYNIWGYRLDSTPLNYLKSPREAWASVKSSPVVQLFISFLLLIIIANYIVYRIIANKIDNWKYIKNFPFVAVSLFLTAALIIPIRGGFGIAPMNHSTVYFSPDNFANISAVNAPWNFFSSLVHKSNSNVNPFIYVPITEAQRSTRDLYNESGQTTQVLNTKGKKPNVIFIVWESFTKKAVGMKYNDIEVTPNFNQLKQEGIYFSDAYSVGDRTDKGIVTILSGFPSQPTESIIKNPKKSASLPILSKDFEQHGYTTEFYYGGDVDFANMKSYLFSANFNKIINKDEFPEELSTSKWGVHDEFLFNKFFEDHQVVKPKPFFSTVLTLSSHEPFDVPGEKAILGEKNDELFYNSLHYTDKVLGDFIAKAKTQDWWNNTLIIIVADHGQRMPETGNKVDDFKIPILWTGGALKDKAFEYKGICSQMDIASTLLAQMNFDRSLYSWSRNLFDKSVKPWAFFVFNNGFGYVKPDKQFVFDNVGRRTISQKGNITDKDIKEAKTLQQRTFQDYLDR
ncbi:sulfatase-like hydrolase/transferase [Emticicia sp. CRIBPO]|uniref:LTA synthase family protein n=1 Tax=Emticicia sp. CRIBPO TaxID=2683258 RepID=UPI001411DC25|nr:LTA synthase family protein [Emticicia sp. CRIBPO]NBA84284.1 sulfatase-like hydrolase/transferase [Emticicia sp. CRIBPO]